MFIPDGQIGILNCLIDPRFIQRERVIEEMTGNMLRLTSFQPKVSENGRVNMPIPLVSFDSKGMSEVENLLDSILEEFHKKKPGYIDAMKSYLNVILIKFLRVLDSNMDNREVLKNIFRITPDIFAYIEENFQRRITLKELAEYSFYNPSYFSTIFKESFGITITDFMQIKRYKASLDYVTGTDLPFDEVATLVGFCDKKQFYKVFKKFSNMLPNRYRTNFRKSNLSRKSS
jgi:AraC-like DNA-binding protein